VPRTPWLESASARRIEYFRVQGTAGCSACVAERALSDPPRSVPFARARAPSTSLRTDPRHTQTADPSTGDDDSQANRHFPLGMTRVEGERRAPAAQFLLDLYPGLPSGAKICRSFGAGFVARHFICSLLNTRRVFFPRTLSRMTRIGLEASYPLLAKEARNGTHSVCALRRG
jgi:hypothetical protein